MKPIGGFFELENEGAGTGAYHDGGLALDSGRSCFQLLIRHLRPGKIYLPFYTCDALIQPVAATGTPYEFYHLNENLEIAGAIPVGDQEYIVYINYFGLKSGYVARLISRYGQQVILDDTHAFFQRGYVNNYSFNSARKLFGVPDGGYLLGPGKPERNLAPNTRISTRHLEHRKEGRLDLAYAEFTEYENSFSPREVGISAFSAHILEKIEYDSVIQKRRDNFGICHSQLRVLNTLNLAPSEIDVPFCYPFLPEQSKDKNAFYREKIFIPTLWPDLLHRDEEGFEAEKRFSGRLLPLPIDHRYENSDMMRLVAAVKSIFGYA